MLIIINKHTTRHCAIKCCYKGKCYSLIISQQQGVFLPDDVVFDKITLSFIHNKILSIEQKEKPENLHYFSIYSKKIIENPGLYKPIIMRPPSTSFPQNEQKHNKKQYWFLQEKPKDRKYKLKRRIKQQQKLNKLLNELKNN